MNLIEELRTEKSKLKERNLRKNAKALRKNIYVQNSSWSSHEQQFKLLSDMKIQLFKIGGNKF